MNIDIQLINELERAAYNAGDMTTASLCDEVARLTEENTALKEGVETLFELIQEAQQCNEAVIRTVEVEYVFKRCAKYL